LALLTIRTSAQGTASEFFVTFAVLFFGLRRFGVMFSRMHTEQSAALNQLLAAMTVTQETVITDAMRAIWHHMHQKTPDEFFRRQAHRFDLVAIPVVFPFKLDLITLDI
jgi:hypothetical protein